MNSAVFMYFVLPFFIGIMLRFLFLKWEKGYLLSGVLILISVIAWLWTSYLVHHGTDGTLLLWAVMATELTVGSVITGGISLLIKMAKHRKADNLF